MKSVLEISVNYNNYKITRNLYQILLNYLLIELYLGDKFNIKSKDKSIAMTLMTSMTKGNISYTVHRTHSKLINKINASTIDYYVKTNPDIPVLCVSIKLFTHPHLSRNR